VSRSRGRDREGAPSRARDSSVIGGRRAVVEAVRSGRATAVLAARGVHRNQAMREVLAGADAAGVPVRWMERRELDALGLRDHQGVAALLPAVHELDERQLASTDFGPQALVVVLDGIVDPQNLGACARAAEAAGASMLVARKRRAAPLSPAALRASAGALAHVPMARVANIPRAVEHLKDMGFFVAGLDQGATEGIHDAPRPEGRLALVVGSEEKGMARLVRERCDLLVSIPMEGRTASLNAASALAVGLFAYALRPEPGAGA
jgi:23S rRNA (guanosine2251-2'-O)-methyltransferase